MLACKLLKRMAPQVGLEPTTLRLTAGEYASRWITPQWFQGAQESLRQTGSASPTCDAVMRSRRGQSILRRAAISFRGCHQLPPIVIDVELFTIRIPVSPP